MSYNLWIDDQAYDLSAPNRFAPKDFLVAESSGQAITLFLSLGFPKFVDFDHDLGETDTSMK